MPRGSREKSESGIYHVIIRGANRQEIFHTKEDKLRFLEILKKYKTQAEVEVYGWVLMGNHVHLLIKEGKEDLSLTMKRIGVSFVWYYNFKYKTTGHLFQDRFRSEKVETDEYLLTVVRYIHQNPIKAGIVKKVVEWEWSSCRGYYGESVFPEGLLDSEFVLRIFSHDMNYAIERFIEFNTLQNNDHCLEDKVFRKVRLSDEEAKLEILNQIDGMEIAKVKSLPKKQRDEILRNIKEIEGISQRQAARIFGVSENLIFKA